MAVEAAGRAPVCYSRAWGVLVFRVSGGAAMPATGCPGAGPLVVPHQAAAALNNCHPLWQQFDRGTSSEKKEGPRENGNIAGKPSNPGG